MKMRTFSSAKSPEGHHERTAAAHVAYNRALRSGKLVRPDRCQTCKRNREELAAQFAPRKKELIHGHHEDYSMPLVVIWLCQHCHSHGWHSRVWRLANAEHVHQVTIAAHAEAKAREIAGTEPA